MKFEDLGLAESLLRAVARENYTTPTDIQAACIPPVLQGRDVLGCAQTGTGKTAAFALPILQRLAEEPSTVNGRGRKIRCLVLAPTRELALQICESFQVYGRHTRLRQTVVFGGVNQTSQVRALNGGVDILVATPGRLIDLMQQGHVELGKVETLVLDEADRMLDMGFLPDLRRIVAKVPKKRQTLLFSATIPGPIRQLAADWMNDPIDIRVAPESVAADNIEQSVFHVPARLKLQLLTQWLQQTAWARILVFTRTKHGADKVAKALNKAGIPADAFHGNKSQNARQRALEQFKSPRPRVLVATDIAARGLDIDNVSHVVNYDMPVEPENYVHRIGRSARAGMTGVAVSFCSAEERPLLNEVQRLTREKITVEPQPEGIPMPDADAAPTSSNGRQRHGGGGSGKRRSGGSVGDRQRRSDSGGPNRKKSVAKASGSGGGPKRKKSVATSGSGGGPKRKEGVGKARQWSGTSKSKSKNRKTRRGLGAV